MRRSGRIPKEVPILLTGSDLEGKIFSEHTKTVVLSLHGAGLVSRHKLSPEQELVLRWPERNKEAEIRVVGQIGSDSGSYTYGVAFFDSVVNFWEMEFPPVSPLERELGLISLVCNVCHTHERIDDNSIEADVCATNNGVLRYCKNCGSSTVWKLAQSGSPALAKPQARTPVPTRQRAPISDSSYSATPPEDLIPGGLPTHGRMATTSPATPPARISDSAPPSSPSANTSVLTLPAASEKPAAPRGADRRKYPRVKVNYLALVRYPGRDDDVVQCEDVSRGGLRFKSRNKYFERALIEVAAPYSTGQPAIFVPAQIVFVQELPEQNLCRYGVAFLKSIRPRDSF